MKALKRTYPVDIIAPVAKRYQAHITIPDGYQVAAMPETCQWTAADIKVTYEASLNDNVLQITAFSHFMKPSYPPSAYQQVRKAFENIVRYFNQEIALEKIGF